MKCLKLLLITCMVLLPPLCQAAEEGYGYPAMSSYAATIMGTPDELKPDLPAEIPMKELVFDVIPDLKKPEIFFYNEGVRCSIALQDKKAPLVFLIPGTGASHTAPKVLSMLKALYKNGYHVVALTSPIHANFIVAASRSHIPGDLTDDAADLYGVMENVWSRIKGKIEVSDFYLGGYSLGGTQAAFVAKLDEERKSFNFRKVVMVNPAVSLYNSVSRIEGLLDNIPGGPRKVGEFFYKMLDKFTQFYRQGDYIDINNEFLYAVYKSGLVGKDEAGGLIGIAFRISSAGMIFASDVMTNGGYVVPKNRVLTNADSLQDYVRVSLHLSFLDYFNEYFTPYFQKKQPGLTREALIEAESLKSIEGYLKSSQKFAVMTNEDDFILAPGDLDYLKQLFGERTKVYPRGGHLGNLEYRDNMATMVESIGFFNKK